MLSVGGDPTGQAGRDRRTCPIRQIIRLPTLLAWLPPEDMSMSSSVDSRQVLDVTDDPRSHPAVADQLLSGSELGQVVTMPALLGMRPVPPLQQQVTYLIDPRQMFDTTHNPALDARGHGQSRRVRYIVSVPVSSGRPPCDMHVPVVVNSCEMLHRSDHPCRRWPKSYSSSAVRSSDCQGILRLLIIGKSERPAMLRVRGTRVVAASGISGVRRRLGHQRRPSAANDLSTRCLGVVTGAHEADRRRDPGSPYRLDQPCPVRRRSPNRHNALPPESPFVFGGCID
jgi:hypothetical protein